MPLVQGAVNREIRDVQLNSELFNAPIAVFSGEGDVRSEVPVCKAARKVFSALAPLFSLYLELPQHRDATLTILDRGVRGFVSAAREEVEATSFRWKSAESGQLREIVTGMMADPLFAVYRRCVYDGKESVEELISLANKSSLQNVVLKGGPRAHASSSLNSIAPSQSSQDDGNAAADFVSRNNAKEMESWGSLWQLNGIGSSFSADKFAEDPDTIGRVAAIARACDWIVLQLFK